jgi:16S rRNA (cytidine1402-2'-O)-methyltransferase
LGDDAAAAEAVPLYIDTQLKNIRYFLVENLRTARRFISSRKLGLVLDTMHFKELTKDSEKADIVSWMKSVPKEEPIGVLSEAGCPGIADPGALAVSIAHQNGRKVIPLVGPSSILLALMASGFSGQQFCFHGYLPIDKEQRAKAIKTLEKESKTRQQTQLFIETPYRNDKLLQDLVNLLEKDTRLCVAADISTLDERIWSQPVQQWKQKTIPVLGKSPAIFLLFAGH